LAEKGFDSKSVRSFR